ncbi:hypothetical protein GCM10007304_32040 [Rhodococcoides trifolii]|uniref:Uncharacterized protein n=1 Tax=Rhodococcoides trifolii TaxID=908250 RepID=A0A917FZY0_9NOCA|nr:hypothetical protein [Rhodococcus trifolii]GGG15552.1 hypothetical protein GCM10007304_32040 [Rhodococcus trifolii]
MAKTAIDQWDTMHQRRRVALFHNPSVSSELVDTIEVRKAARQAWFDGLTPAQQTVMIESRHGDVPPELYSVLDQESVDGKALVLDSELVDFLEYVAQRDGLAPRP